MPIENSTVYRRQILEFVWLTQTKFYKKDQKKFWNENSDKDISIKRQLSDGIDRNRHFWTWNIIFWFYRKESNYKVDFTLQLHIISRGGSRVRPLMQMTKWRNFLWNVKQAKKRFRGVLIQSSNLCIFPRGLWCAKFSPWFPPSTSYFEACRLRVIAEVLKFSGLNSLLWSIQFENICRSFSWKS